MSRRGSANLDDATTSNGSSGNNSPRSSMNSTTAVQSSSAVAVNSMSKQQQQQSVLLPPLQGRLDVRIVAARRLQSKGVVLNRREVVGVAKDSKDRSGVAVVRRSRGASDTNADTAAMAMMSANAQSGVGQGVLDRNFENAQRVQSDDAGERRNASSGSFRPVIGSHERRASGGNVRAVGPFSSQQERTQGDSRRTVDGDVGAVASPAVLAAQKLGRVAEDDDDDDASTSSSDDSFAGASIGELTLPTILRPETRRSHDLLMQELGTLLQDDDRDNAGATGADGPVASPDRNKAAVPLNKPTPTSTRSGSILPASGSGSSGNAPGSVLPEGSAQENGQQFLSPTAVWLKPSNARVDLHAQRRRPRGESAGSPVFEIDPELADQRRVSTAHGLRNSVEITRTKPPLFVYAIVQVDQQQEHTPCAPRIFPDDSSDMDHEEERRDELCFAPWNHHVTFDVTSSKSVLSVSVWGTYSNEGGQQFKSEEIKANNTGGGGAPGHTAASTVSAGLPDKRPVHWLFNRPSTPLPKPHYNTVGEFLGRFRIPATALQHGKTIEDWFRLSSLDRDEDIPGSVRVRMKFTPSLGGQSSSMPSVSSSASGSSHSGRNVSLKDFVLLRVVGRGTFAKVLQVRKVDTGRLYAMKTIKKDHLIEQNAVRHTFSEKNVLERLHHPFIVNLKFAFQTTDRLVMVLDYISGGELFYHLSENRLFPEARARFYAAEIASALGYLHSHNVIYRDLKPENMLLDTDGHVILTDFGLCKEGLGYGERTHTFCGSPEYMAPEMLRGDGYDKGVDWWALGTFLFEMMAGLPPFFCEDEDEMNERILHDELSFPPGFSEKARDVLQGLLERDPLRRLGSGPSGFYELKKHPFFADYIDFDLLEAKCIPPPMRPPLTSDTDVRYFDPDATKELPLFSVEESRLTEREQQDYFAGFAYTAPDVDLNQVKHTHRERRRRFASIQSQASQQSWSTLSSEVTSTTDRSRVDLGSDQPQSPLFHTPQPVRDQHRLFHLEDDSNRLPANPDGPFEESDSDGYYSDPDRNAQRAVMLKRYIKPQPLVRSSSHEMFTSKTPVPKVAEEFGKRTRANAFTQGELDPKFKQ